MRTTAMVSSTLKWAAVIIVVAAVAFGIGWRLNDGSGSEPEDTATPVPTLAQDIDVTPTAALARSAQQFSVDLTASGLSVSSLLIRAGDTVIFTNRTDGSYWPASDPHPTHDQCPGFDAKRVLRRGESYALQFTSPQVCGFHDHTDSTNASRRGTITVR